MQNPMQREQGLKHESHGKGNLRKEGREGGKKGRKVGRKEGRKEGINQFIKDLELGVSVEKGPELNH